MSTVRAKFGIRKATVSAVVTRANGRVENLGVISATHKNPIINFFWQVRIYINGLLRY